MPGIKSSGTLTYFDGAAVGKWAGITKLAVAAFNQMPNNLVTYKPTKEKTSAHVVIGVADGNGSFPYGGNNSPIVFPNHSTHGRTRTFDMGNGGIEKAAIFVPSKPKYTQKGVMIVILAHELLHACGLVQHDQSDGLLVDNPNIQNGKVFAAADTKKMPPLFIGDKTIARMATIW
jgi:hypothetical protein